MKTLLLIALLGVMATNGKGQKINNHTYKVVDSVFQYKDGMIVYYTDKKGKRHIDVIYNDKRKYDIEIETANYVVVDTDNLIPNIQ